MHKALYCVALSCILAAMSVHAKPVRAQVADTPQKPPVVKKLESTKKINLNKANADDLLHAVKGIGKKRAEAIVAYRESHQNFKSIDELAEVKGFGKRYVQMHQDELEKAFTLNSTL